MKFYNKNIKKTTVLSLSSCIILLISIAFFTACQSTEQKHDQATTTEADVHHDHEQAGDAGLSLNNGAKWKADASTNANVAAMNQISSQAAPASLEDFTKTGNDLQTGIDKMIKECRMEGPDHEALHHWLEPLMEKNKALLGAKSVEEATEIFGDLKKQIELYPQFFE